MRRDAVPAPELSVATETLTGAPLEKAQIVILPTDDSEAGRNFGRRLTVTFDY